LSVSVIRFFGPSTLFVICDLELVISSRRASRGPRSLVSSRYQELSMSMKMLRLALVAPALWISIGCGSPVPEPPSSSTTITPEEQAKIDAEDASVEAAEMQQAQAAQK
jgi:hypothetical protein